MLVTSKVKAQSTKELVAASVQILIEALEAGHSEVLTSCLTAIARLHTYSSGNILLIAAQKRDASQVAGMYAWNQSGRRVKRGEKGILILDGGAQDGRRCTVKMRSPTRVIPKRRTRTIGYLNFGCRDSDVSSLHSQKNFRGNSSSYSGILGPIELRPDGSGTCPDSG